MVFLDEVFVGEEHIGLYFDSFGRFKVFDEFICLIFRNVEGQLISIRTLTVLLLCLFTHHCLIYVLLAKDHLLRGHVQLRLFLFFLASFHVLLEVQFRKLGPVLKLKGLLEGNLVL
jgi:hypothetical protein